MKRAIKRQICLSKWFILSSFVVFFVYVTLHSYHKMVITRNDQVRIVPDHLRYDDGKVGDPLRYAEEFKDNVTEEERKTPLNVYVVEEHHEVIPYWYKAANAGLIPKLGNTLIHIDGHSDMAPPRYYRKFPFFTWPKNTGQLKYFMQENDMFVLSAAISGLISKIVWIWPNWDKRNHDEPLHFIQKLEIGWTMIKTRIPNLMRKEFCMCMPNSTDELDCRVLPLTTEDEETYEKGVPLRYSDCNIQRTILYEEFQENDADRLMKFASSYLEKGNAILDIDEDYYGCTYASQPIRDVGVTVKQIEKFDDIVSELFCPLDAKGELEADRILVEVLQKLNKISCAQNGQRLANGKLCGDSKNVKEILEELKSKLKNEKSHLMCKNIESLSQFLQNLTTLFMHLDRRQNKALQFVGFCFSSSPRTYSKLFDSVFQVCQGSNSPENSAVLVHNTNSKEVTRRTHTLKSILSWVKPVNPGIVTVCRSGRDGYTPRHLFNQIENDVMATLQSVFKNLHVTYDVGLLGGIKGWAKRYDFL